MWVDSSLVEAVEETVEEEEGALEMAGEMEASEA